MALHTVAVAKNIGFGNDHLVGFPVAAVKTITNQLKFNFNFNFSKLFINNNNNKFNKPRAYSTTPTISSPNLKYRRECWTKLIASSYHDDEVFEWGDEGGPYKGFERCSLDDPWVIMMARFVIQQFNNLNNANLQFVRVVKAISQFIPHEKYYLTLEAMDGDEEKTYQAKVYHSIVMDRAELILFRFLGHDQKKPLILYVAPSEQKQLSYQIKELEERKQLNYQLTYQNKTFKAPTSADANRYHFHLATYSELLSELEGIATGGIRRYCDPLNDPKLISMACFAIEEFNKLENANLQFVRVVKAASQTTGVGFYYLTLEAMDAGEKKTYYAKVYWHCVQKRNELIFFRLLGEKLLNLFIKPKDKSDSI